jgi:carbamoyl-phosphate synthase large subunit
MSALPVLVLGVGGQVGQGILKAIALSTLPVRVVGACIGPHSAGLYTTETAYISPSADSPAFVPWLIDTCAREGIRAVLSGVEPVLRTMAAHRAAIEAATGAVCIVSAPEVLAIGDDKLLTCQWLETHGFNAPRCVSSDDRAGLERLVSKVAYPLIAKPRAGKGGQGVHLVNNAAELDCVRTRSDMVVQEYLGNADSEYTVGCFVDNGGRVCGSIAMRRRLQQGTTIFAEIGEYPIVREEAERIVAALRPVASCNVQLRIHEDRPVAFEVNVRFSGTTPMRARFGFNDVEAALRHYVLHEPVGTLPRITDGLAVRYWNEMYVSREAFEMLSRDGFLKNPRAFSFTVEEF